MNLDKNGLGYILGIFFTNKSGHPVCAATCSHFKAAPARLVNCAIRRSVFSTLCAAQTWGRRYDHIFFDFCQFSPEKNWRFSQKQLL
jgi:hypothetical protein